MVDTKKILNLLIKNKINFFSGFLIVVPVNYVIYLIRTKKLKIS